MENKPFKYYQKSNISSICSFAYLWHRVLPPLDPQTQEGFLSPHSIGSEIVAASELYYLFRNNRKQRKKWQVGGACRHGEKELVVGGHTQPKPSQDLEKQVLIFSPCKTSLYRGKVLENLRQLQEGREQGLRRPSQHGLRRNDDALIHERRPQQHIASLTCMYTAHFLAAKQTLAACTHSNV